MELPTKFWEDSRSQTLKLSRKEKTRWINLVEFFAELESVQILQFSEEPIRCLQDPSVDEPSEALEDCDQESSQVVVDEDPSEETADEELLELDQQQPIAASSESLENDQEPALPVIAEESHRRSLLEENPSASHFFSSLLWSGDATVLDIPTSELVLPEKSGVAPTRVSPSNSDSALSYFAALPWSGEVKLNLAALHQPNPKLDQLMAAATQQAINTSRSQREPERHSDPNANTAKAYFSRIPWQITA